MKQAHVKCVNNVIFACWICTRVAKQTNLILKTQFYNSRLTVFNCYTGYYALGPASEAVPSNFALGQLAYQAQPVDPAVALTYAQQLQQPQQPYLQAYQPAAAIYQAQLAQLLALRQAQLAQQGQLHAIPSEQVSLIMQKRKWTHTRGHVYWQQSYIASYLINELLIR